MRAPQRPSLYQRSQRALFRISRRLPVPDFDVRLLFPVGDEAQCATDRISSALTILRTLTPTRYACLRRDLPRILVGTTHALAECHSPIGICLLQVDFVVAAGTAPEYIALALVHEGTHARLNRAGFGYEEAQRARIERLCVTAEIIVASRLPDAQDLVSHITARLPTPSSNQWTNDAMLERRLQALRELGFVGRVGSFIVRVLKPFTRRRARRAA